MNASGFRVAEGLVCIDIRDRRVRVLIPLYMLFMRLISMVVAMSSDPCPRCCPQNEYKPYLTIWPSLGVSSNIHSASLVDTNQPGECWLTTYHTLVTLPSANSMCRIIFEPPSVSKSCSIVRLTNGFFFCTSAQSLPLTALNSCSRSHPKYLRWLLHV